MKQRQRIFARATKKLEEAAVALSDVMDVAREFDVPTDREEYFIRELHERSGYLGRCTWWRQEPAS